MTNLGSFLAGFVTGWAVRSAVDSPSGVAVRLLDAAYRARARIRRWIAVERGRIEDLVAEVRARHEGPEPVGGRSRGNGGWQPGSR